MYVFMQKYRKLSLNYPWYLFLYGTLIPLICMSLYHILFSQKKNGKGKNETETTGKMGTKNDGKTTKTL